MKGRAWQHWGGVQRVTHSMEREHFLFYSCAKIIGILRRRSTSESYTCLRFSINHNISRSNRGSIALKSRINRAQIAASLSRCLKLDASRYTYQRCGSHFLSLTDSQVRVTCRLCRVRTCTRRDCRYDNKARALIAPTWPGPYPCTMSHLTVRIVGVWRALQLID